MSRPPLPSTPSHAASPLTCRRTAPSDAEDVLAFLAERDNDDHLHKVRKSGAAAAEVSTRAQDESALFEDDEDDEEIVVKGSGEAPSATVKSVQRAKSAARKPPTFEGLRTLASGNHKVQDIKDLMKVPGRTVSSRAHDHEPGTH